MEKRKLEAGLEDNTQIIEEVKVKKKEALLE